MEDDPHFAGWLGHRWLDLACNVVMGAYIAFSLYVLLDSACHIFAHWGG